MFVFCPVRRYTVSNGSGRRFEFCCLYRIETGMNRKVRACSFSARFGGTPPPTGQDADSSSVVFTQRKTSAFCRCLSFGVPLPLVAPPLGDYHVRRKCIPPAPRFCFAKRSYSAPPRSPPPPRKRESPPGPGGCQAGPASSCEGGRKKTRDTAPGRVPCAVFRGWLIRASPGGKVPHSEADRSAENFDTETSPVDAPSPLWPEGTSVT